MKLLFLECQPSSELAAALKQNGIFFEAKKSLQGIHTEPFSLIVKRVSDTSGLKALSDLRSKAPHCWIVALVPETWLGEPGAYADLLSAKEKDDVWFESHWESSFWLGLQRAVQSQASRQREQTLQKELESIKLAQETLVLSSQKLVDKMAATADLTLQTHRALYPRFSPDVPGVEVLSKYLPASGTGGDYFDLFEFSDKRRFGFLLADSKTHKTAASLLSTLLSVRLDDLRTRFPKSISFVDHLNDGMALPGTTSSSGLKLLYGVFDRGTLGLDVTAAGEIGAFLGRKGHWSRLSLESNPELPTPRPVPWKNTVLELQAGDILLFASDGVSAHFGNGLEPFRGELERIAGNKSAHEVRNALLAEIAARTEKEPPKDDLTFIIITVDARAHFMRPVASIGQGQSK
jgi:phosphoserine phosphatase RsbU/P